MLKPLGFFSELGQALYLRESLRAAVSDVPISGEAASVNYLSTGHVLLNVQSHHGKYRIR
jgi:hypothetical protein